MKTKVINITNNNGNKAPNQFILSDGGTIYFQSYKTTIAKYQIQGDKLTLDHYTHDMSRTTAKYLYIFVNRYCSSANVLSSANDVREYNKQHKTTNLN